MKTVSVYLILLKLGEKPVVNFNQPVRQKCSNDHLLVQICSNTSWNL